MAGPARSKTPTALRAARDEAEDLTNEIMARYFDVLSPDEVAELARLLADTRNAIDM